MNKYLNYFQEIKSLRTKREKINFVSTNMDSTFKVLLEILLDRDKYIFNISKKNLKKLETNLEKSLSLIDTTQEFIDWSTNNERELKTLETIFKKSSIDSWELIKNIIVPIKIGISGKQLSNLIDINTFEVMLASSNKTKLSNDIEYIVEPKLDGLRLLAFVDNTNNSIILRTRSGKYLNGFYEIERDLLKISKDLGNVVFDGELITPNNNFQDLMKKASRKIPIEDGLEYHIFDMVPTPDFESGLCRIPLYNRKKFLSSLINTTSVKIVPYKISYLEEIDINEYIENSYEGFMVKELLSHYECKRSNSWVKFKPSDDYTMVISSIIEGQGNFSGTLGALSGYLEDNPDIKLKVGTGFSIEERDYIFHSQENLIGKRVDVVADSITTTGSLRFPRFIRIKEDK